MNYYVCLTYNNVNNRYAFKIPRTTVHTDIENVYEKRWEQMIQVNVNFVQYFLWYNYDKWHP